MIDSSCNNVKYKERKIANNEEFYSDEEGYAIEYNL